MKKGWKSLIFWCVFAVILALIVELGWPEYNGITLDGDGNAYIGSVAGGIITKVELSTGETSAYVSFPDGSANDLEWTEDGVIYFSDLIRGKVKSVDSDGNINVVATHVSGANSLDFDENGILYVACDFLGDGLYRIEEGNVTEINAEIHGLNGFEVRDGYLYGPLWYDGQIVKIDLDTGLIEEIFCDDLVQPSAVNLDTEGNIYALDGSQGLVYRIDVSTKEKDVIATLPKYLDNLAIDENNNIYVTSRFTRELYRIDANTWEITCIVHHSFTKNHLRILVCVIFIGLLVHVQLKKIKGKKL